MMPKLNSHFEAIDMLGSLGFKIPTIEKTQVIKMKEAITFIAGWEARREEYNYEIDGMVLKVDSFDLQNRCGTTSHHPRWAIAFKFKAKQATTKLINVEYQVGKIGSITPVAKLQPVSLAGVTISSVSLHNEEFIKARDLHIGDTVLVERAGDVIPYIVKAIEDERDGSEQVINFPTHCPINGTEDAPELIKIEGEAAWRCINCTCGAQDLQKMIFHVSKEAMDIDGFGSSYVERFYELGWLSDLSDIYNLDYDKIASLEGFGKKSAENLFKAIEKAKNNPISRLLHSLTIHHLGKRASKIIAEQIDHVLDLCDWDLEKYLALKDIGPVVAENMVAFFEKKESIALLKRMEELGVNLAQTDEDKPKVLNESGVLFGKTILFTGTLTNMGRKEAEQKAEALGAKNISAVSKNLDILVVGESAGSKLTKAQSIPTITIYTEAEFIYLITSN
jgi:DNA ligase (NAD+)